MSSASADGAARHLPEIDILKGCCALWVLLIHAEAMPAHPLMLYVFNRAAPLFVVMMGLNGELWWRRRLGRPRVRSWYVDRFWRLYPPMWAAVAVWWLFALFLPHHAPLTPILLVKHLLGDLVGIGTAWFVTLALMVSIVFPLLHWAARRFGMLPLLALGVLSTCASVTYRFEMMHSLGMFGWQVFPTRLLADLTFGMALAPHVGRLGWRAGALAAAACAMYFAVPLALGPRAPWQLLGGSALGASDATTMAYRLMDLPTSVLLLQGCAALAALPWISRPFAWLGRESYGIYLGQAVTHNVLVMNYSYPFAITRFGTSLYVMILLVGALAWVVGYNLAERWLGAALERLRPAVLSQRGSTAQRGAGTWT